MASYQGHVLTDSLLVLDDFGIGEMSTQVAHVMLEIVDGRMRTGSLLIAKQ